MTVINGLKIRKHQATIRARNAMRIAASTIDCDLPWSSGVIEEFIVLKFEFSKIVNSLSLPLCNRSPSLCNPALGDFTL